MEDARIRETGESITGEDLWYLENLESYSYECIFCEVECRPISYVKDLNKRRPHFRKLSEHIDCIYESENSNVRKQRKRSKIRREDGTPGHYPSQFSLPSSRSRNNINDDKPKKPPTKDDEKTTHSRHNDKGTRNAPNRDRPYRTSSFRLIVNHYLNFPDPKDRDLPFSAEFIDGYSFRTCFKNLFTNKDVPLIKPKNKIYYSASSWSKAQVTNESMTIIFGSYAINKQSEKQNLYLEINLSEWKSNVISAFLHDYEKSRLEVIKSEGKKKLLVFFIGTQDLSNPLKFTTSDPRLVSLNVVSLK